MFQGFVWHHGWQVSLNTFQKKGWVYRFSLWFQQRAFPWQQSKFGGKSPLNVFFSQSIFFGITLKNYNSKYLCFHLIHTFQKKNVIWCANLAIDKWKLTGLIMLLSVKKYGHKCKKKEEEVRIRCIWKDMIASSSARLHFAFCAPWAPCNCNKNARKHPQLQ